jgi:hypothetical protein
MGAFRMFAVEPKNEIKVFKHKLLFKVIKYLCTNIKKKFGDTKIGHEIRTVKYEDKIVLLPMEIRCCCT